MEWLSLYINKILYLISDNFASFDETNTAATTPPEALDPGNVINGLFPNAWDFIAHAFAMVILLFAVVYLIWKPAKKALEARNKFIQDKIDEANRIAADSLITGEQINASKLEAKLQISKMLDDAVADGYRIKETMQREATQSANRITKEAHDQILKEEVKVRENIQHQIIDLAFTVAQAITEKEIDQATNKKMIDDLLAKIKDGKN